MTVKKEVILVEGDGERRVGGQDQRTWACFHSEIPLLRISIYVKSDALLGSP